MKTSGVVFQLGHFLGLPLIFASAPAGLPSSTVAKPELFGKNSRKRPLALLPRYLDVEFGERQRYAESIACAHLSRTFGDGQPDVGPTAYLHRFLTLTLLAEPGHRHVDQPGVHPTINMVEKAISPGRDGRRSSSFVLARCARPDS